MIKKIINYFFPKEGELELWAPKLKIIGILLFILLLSMGLS